MNIMCIDLNALIQEIFSYFRNTQKIMKFICIVLVAIAFPENGFAQWWPMGWGFCGSSVPTLYQQCYQPTQDGSVRCKGMLNEMFYLYCEKSAQVRFLVFKINT